MESLHIWTVLCSNLDWYYSSKLIYQAAYSRMHSRMSPICSKSSITFHSWCHLVCNRDRWNARLEEYSCIWMHLICNTTSLRIKSRVSCTWRAIPRDCWSCTIQSASRGKWGHFATYVFVTRDTSKITQFSCQLIGWKQFFRSHHSEPGSDSEKKRPLNVPDENDRGEFGDVNADSKHSVQTPSYFSSTNSDDWDDFAEEIPF